jgi:ABC-type amino acid transport substrate-binding protein
VAFCPGPPLLLPAVAGRAAEDTAALRRACDAAVAAVLAARPEVVVVVGDGAPDGVRYGAGDVGDLRGFGVDLRIPFSGGVRPGGTPVPLAHTVGAWLLDRAGHTGVRLGVGPADLARALEDCPGPVAVLAVGDGSARRTLKAPGYLDPAAEPFDDAVAAALAAGDADALAALDPAEGARLLAAGVPTWRAVGAALAGRRATARLHLHEAPFGVGYLVADWHLP